MVPYTVLMHKIAFQNSEKYLHSLQKTKVRPGKFLEKMLTKNNCLQLTPVEFIELLVNTKKPQIFAESEVVGDGTDWNQTELSILGDIAISVPVAVFDNGLHYRPVIYPEPIKATLLFIPGALLLNGNRQVPADWNEVTDNNQINPKLYDALYERRLLPGFIYADRIAQSKNKQAFITIPGLGCGQFAGKFRGHMGAKLKNALICFLKKNDSRFSNIKAVYFDPYNECDNERLEINGISFFVHPLTKGNEHKSQLSEPHTFEEFGDCFKNCELFSFVAWDHVSWPGNDFYLGHRSTDDGVKAAATNSMMMMTGVKGTYSIQNNTYDPPNNFRNWEEVVIKNKIYIHVKDNLFVLPDKSANMGS